MDTYYEVYQKEINKFGSEVAIKTWENLSSSEALIIVNSLRAKGLTEDDYEIMCFYQGGEQIDHAELASRVGWGMNGIKRFFESGDNTSLINLVSSRHPFLLDRFMETAQLENGCANRIAVGEPPAGTYSNSIAQSILEPVFGPATKHLISVPPRGEELSPGSGVTRLAHMLNPDIWDRNLLAVECLESNLHPLMYSVLSAGIYKMAAKYHVQVYASTHSELMVRSMYELLKEHGKLESMRFHRIDHKNDNTVEVVTYNVFGLNALAQFDWKYSFM